MDKPVSICFAMSDPDNGHNWFAGCEATGFTLWEMHRPQKMRAFPCALIIADSMEQLNGALAHCMRQSEQKIQPYKILLRSLYHNMGDDIFVASPDEPENNIRLISKNACDAFAFQLSNASNLDHLLSPVKGKAGLDDGTHVFLEQSLFGVVVLQKKKVCLLNEKARELIGIPPEKSIDELILRDFIPQDKADNFRQVMHEIISGELSAKIISIPVISAKKENIVLQAWLSQVYYKGAAALLVFFTDMGELLEARKRGRKYEMEYFRVHKMAMVGKLASGLAHNLNTPVSIIQGNAELLELQYPDNHELKMILKQTARLGREIHLLGIRGNKDLSTLSEEIDLNELIQNEMDFLNANLYFKHYVDCRLELDKQLPALYGLYSDFSQILSEIIENAIDAMYGLDKRILTVKTQYADGHIGLIISDTGKGMDDKTLEHIFEPFYTTKASPDENIDDPNAPRGTGLGLSMAMSILNKYHGKITVHSKVGAGTEFKIILPAIQS